jgi:hypothetical protein
LPSWTFDLLLACHLVALCFFWFLACDWVGGPWAFDLLVGNSSVLLFVIGLWHGSYLAKRGRLKIL